MIESLQIVILIIIVLVFLAHIWLGTLIKIGFGREFKRDSSKSKEYSGTKKSILVAGKNEADHLNSLFGLIENQSQTPDEFIFIDDGSTDATSTILSKLDSPNLKVISIADSRGKRNALKTALNGVAEGRVILTDADCKPRPRWVESHQGGEREVIVGYAPIQSSGLVRELVAHETFLTATMTASAIGHKRAYMATGRNWSYPIDLYREVNGFDGIDKGISGDDDLLLQKMVSLPDVTATFVFDPQTWVFSDGPTRFSEWLHQKRRHSSAGRYYSMGSKIALASIQVLNLLLWLMPFVNQSIFLIFGLFFKYFFTHRGARLAFNYRISFPRFVLREFLYLLYHLVVIPIGLLAPPKKW